MKRCKYLLPCGRCDQRGALCDATVEQIEVYNSLESPEECEHEWRYEGELGNRRHYRCIKCDTLKAVPLSNLDNK